MRTHHRLRKLEKAKGEDFFVGIPEKREGFVATHSGVTHVPFKGVTFERGDYEADAEFWAAIDARKRELGIKTAIWLSSDPRLL